MQISLTKLRNEMFRLLPRLKNDEELVTFEGKIAYVIRKANHDRNAQFLQSLSKCPRLSLQR